MRLINLIDQTIKQNKNGLIFKDISNSKESSSEEKGCF
jgi:hypothetical protein